MYKLRLGREHRRLCTLTGDCQYDTSADGSIKQQETRVTPQTVIATLNSL